jgi:hypothetical protein
MIATLKENKEEANKIGYIYHDVESELYKWLTTTEGIKEYINPLLEKDAHGDEAQYYIVENNREVNQDALSYFKSVYTGVTRSEQGSILIARSDYITKTKNKNGESLLNLNKYNSNGVKFKSIKAKEMNPDTYKEEGTKNFIKKRKNTLDYIYQNQKLTPFNIKYRSKNPIITDIQNLNQPQPEP